MKRYTVKPKPNKYGEILLGGKIESEDYIYLGRLAESGPITKVNFDVSEPRVIAVFGKRGSGKSFTLGSILESLCTTKSNSSISSVTRKSTLILFDTLGIFQWFDVPVDPTSPRKFHRLQTAIQQGWEDLDSEELDVCLWQPKGTEPLRENIVEFTISHSDLTAADWAYLFEIDLIHDRMGQLLEDVYLRVTKEGWSDGRRRYLPSQSYTLQNLIECINNDPEVLESYSEETRRALLLDLKSYARNPLFSDTSLSNASNHSENCRRTSLSDLLRPGKLSIILLHKLPDELKSVLIVSLIRRIMEGRICSSEIEKSKEILNEAELAKIDKREEIIPPVWIAIDEVQNFLPSERKSTATDTLVKLVREGRNYGISFIFTTQQPSAVDSRILAQVDTMIVHKLTVQGDIEYVRKNLKCALPDEVKYSEKTLQFDEILRSLDIGQALVSDIEAERAFIVDIRPRINIHGGFSI